MQVTTGRLGLRDAKKRSTRRTLMAASRRLVLQHGLDAVTVEQICAEAGVSVRTFFNYFDSKEHAVIGGDVPLGTADSRATFIAGGPTGDLLDDLFLLTDVEQLLAEEGSDQLAMVHQISMQEPKVLAANLSRLHRHEQQAAGMIAARDFRADAEPTDELIASIALSLIFRATFLWFGTEGRSLAEVFAQARAAAAALLVPTHHPG